MCTLCARHQNHSSTWKALTQARGFSSTSRLSFDDTIRYNIILSYFRETSGDALDVGCGLGTLGKMLEIGGMRLVYLDVKPYLLMQLEGKNRVVADGSTLPFRDKSFDFTISADVLEHLPPPKRRAFIVELLRCTKRKVVFTFCQLHTENPKRLEVILFEFFFKLFRVPYPKWYKEHNALEIPQLSYVRYIIHCCRFYPYTRPYQGILGIFFPLFQGFVKFLIYHGHRRSGQVSQKLVEYFLHFISNIDIPPYYSFAIEVRLGS